MEFNSCILCSVKECAHIASDGHHCSLNTISIATHEANPTQCRCTDCMSFEPSCK